MITKTTKTLCKFLVIITILSCAVHLCSCEFDVEQHSSNETTNQKMFVDEEEALLKIQELKEVYIYSSIVTEDSFTEFKNLLDEADTVVSSGKDVCEYAEKLREAYDNIQYIRGDTPRIYLNTYKPTVNYALDSSVFATTESSEHTAKMAIDGDSKTYWSFAEEEGSEQQILTFDMGEEYEIGYFCIEWGKGAAKKTDVDISHDGEVWETVISFEDGARYKTQGVELEQNVNARYFRIRMIEASSFPYQLEEVIASYEKPARAASLTKTEYKEADVVIVDKEGGIYDDIEEEITLKIRGNSTANTVKNPYNIKFKNKMTILGMKGTRKWALLANLFDKTLMRNKVAADFAAIAGVTPALKNTFVELYLDGEYKGVYILTMPVTDGTVDIDEDKGDMLLERNGYYNTELAGINYNYTPISGIRFVPIVPEKGMETDEEKLKIKNLLKEVEYAVISGDRERIEKVIDLDSFINMYICEELMKDIDIYQSSTYFYYKNELLYSGPIWDMDLSMGNVSVNEGSIDEKYAKYSNLIWNGKKAGNGISGDSTTGNWANVDFYKYLMENMWFRNLVSERYASLIPEIEKLYKDGGVIDSYVEEYGDAFRRNYENGKYSMTDKYFSCEYDEPYETYEENVEYLKDWLNRRDLWIRKDMGIE